MLDPECLTSLKTVIKCLEDRYYADEESVVRNYELKAWRDETAQLLQRLVELEADADEIERWRNRITAKEKNFRQIQDYINVARQVEDLQEQGRRQSRAELRVGKFKEAAQRARQLADEYAASENASHFAALAKRADDLWMAAAVEVSMMTSGVLGETWQRTWIFVEHAEEFGLVDVEVYDTYGKRIGRLPIAEARRKVPEQAKAWLSHKVGGYKADIDIALRLNNSPRQAERIWSEKYHNLLFKPLPEDSMLLKGAENNNTALNEILRQNNRPLIDLIPSILDEDLRAEMEAAKSDIDQARRQQDRAEASIKALGKLEPYRQWAELCAYVQATPSVLELPDIRNMVPEVVHRVEAAAVDMISKLKGLDVGNAHATLSAWLEQYKDFDALKSDDYSGLVNYVPAETLTHIKLHLADLKRQQTALATKLGGIQQIQAKVAEARRQADAQARQSMQMLTMQYAADVLQTVPEYVAFQSELDVRYNTGKILDELRSALDQDIKAIQVIQRAQQLQGAIGNEVDRQILNQVIQMLQDQEVLLTLAAQLQKNKVLTQKMVTQLEQLEARDDQLTESQQSILKQIGTNDKRLRQQNQDEENIITDAKGMFGDSSKRFDERFQSAARELAKCRIHTNAWRDVVLTMLSAMENQPLAQRFDIDLLEGLLDGLEPDEGKRWRQNLHIHINAESVRLEEDKATAKPRLVRRWEEDVKKALADNRVPHNADWEYVEAQISRLTAAMELEEYYRLVNRDYFARLKTPQDWSEWVRLLTNLEPKLQRLIDDDQRRDRQPIFVEALAKIYIYQMLEPKNRQARVQLAKKLVTLGNRYVPNDLSNLSTETQAVFQVVQCADDWMAAMDALEDAVQYDSANPEKLAATLLGFQRGLELFVNNLERGNQRSALDLLMDWYTSQRSRLSAVFSAQPPLEYAVPELVFPNWPASRVLYAATVRELIGLMPVSDSSTIWLAVNDLGSQVFVSGLLPLLNSAADQKDTTLQAADYHARHSHYFRLLAAFSTVIPSAFRDVSASPSETLQRLAEDCETSAQLLRRVDNAMAVVQTFIAAYQLPHDLNDEIEDKCKRKLKDDLDVKKLEWNALIANPATGNMRDQVQVRAQSTIQNEVDKLIAEYATLLEYICEFKRAVRDERFDNTFDMLFDFIDQRVTDSGRTRGLWRDITVYDKWRNAPGAHGWVAVKEFAETKRDSWKRVKDWADGLGYPSNDPAEVDNNTQSIDRLLNLGDWVAADELINACVDMMDDKSAYMTGIKEVPLGIQRNAKPTSDYQLARANAGTEAARKLIEWAQTERFQKYVDFQKKVLPINADHLKNRKAQWARGERAWQESMKRLTTLITIHPNGKAHCSNRNEAKRILEELNNALKEMKNAAPDKPQLRAYEKDVYYIAARDC